jgi:hypothetical protein
MAKYSINDTTLKAIADPLRTLLGLTGGMTPEEMASNGAAVQANVTAALAMVASKGVTVSGDATSDDLAALIGYLVKLPALTTPGAAADLRNGKQLIDGSGNIVAGTLSPVTIYTGSAPDSSVGADGDIYLVVA